MKKIGYLILTFTTIFSTQAQIKVINNISTANIIPKPVISQSLNTLKPFTLNEHTEVYIENDSLINSAEFLIAYLQKNYNLKLETTTQKPTKNSINLISATSFQDYKDTYNLKVVENKIALNVIPVLAYFMVYNH